MSIQLNYSGFAQVFHAIDEIERLATKKAVIDAALHTAAQSVVVRAQTNARRNVRTGALAKSITASKTLNTNQKKAAKAQGIDHKTNHILYIGPSSGGGKRGWHGHFLEFGTAFAPPYPFLRPAWDAESRDIMPRLADALKAELAKALQQKAIK